MPRPRISIADLAPLSAAGAVLTANGYLSIPARVARGGVQEYYAYEFGDLFEGREWNSKIVVWRPADEVFAADSLASFARLPVTNNHPFEDVTAANWREHAVGMTEGEASRAENYVATRLLITEAGAVNDVQRGRRELSTGYSFVPDLAPGVTPAGESYDLIAREIRANHIAIVDAARCGPECRAGDMAKSPALSRRLKDTSMCKCGQPDPKLKDSPMTTRTVAVDGLNVETTEAGAVALQKVLAERDDARAKIAAADAATAATASNHAAALAAKDATIAEAKQAIPDPAKLEQMARDHAAVCDKARAIKADIVTAAKAADTIRREAVVSKLGDKAAGYSAEQILVAFDMLAEAPATPADPFVPAGVVKIEAGDKSSPISARNKTLTDAWKKRPAA